MLEYILFDEHSWRRFIDYLRQLGLDPETSVAEEGWLIALPEDLDEALDVKIEAYYDQLLEGDEAAVAKREGEAHLHAASVNVTLADGRIVQAVIDPKLMQRLLGAVSPRELGEFVDAIAAAVENPDERPLCQR
ncbi:MAG: hypothetical protein G8D66_01010 [gamma proteobacterium symbiont of Ctena orbiculata]